VGSGMATIPGKGPLWWDRDADESGVPIRTDVREAAHAIWQEACHRTRVVLGDAGDAPELMEAAVHHISRHLNRRGEAMPSSANVASLLMLHFCQELRRLAGRLARIRPVGTTADIEERAVSPVWMEKVERWIDFQKLLPHLSERSRKIFRLRLLDHDWKQIGKLLGIAPSTARNAFWEDLRQAQAKRERKNHSK
jgi:DNA-directed RNA polymerase specialized sigma24 family protein